MRAFNTSKNIVAGLITQLVSIFMQFFVRSIFIYTLSSQYLGLNGVFMSILTVLNLSELGIGTAIQYALYKPVANNDTNKTKSLMKFYKSAYRAIGWIFLVLGLSILPFLHIFIKDNTDFININIIYILFLLQTISSYWFFAYKNVILTVNQKQYLTQIIVIISSSVISILKIFALFIFRNTPVVSFYLYTIIGVFGNILSNILIARKVDKLYPFINEKDAKKLTKDELRDILKNVFSLSLAKISSALYSATDNIIISSYIGLVIVGIYSNYLLIIHSVKKILVIIFGSITPSLGNLCALESIDRKESVFNSLQLLYFWIYGFSAISFLVLFNPFIGGVWLNPTYLLSNWTIIIITMNFLLDGLMGAVIKFREAEGLFWQTRYRYVLSALSNVIVSIILVSIFNMGIEGVVLGTSFSVLITISVDPSIVFKHVFKKKPFHFYKKYIKQLFLVLITWQIIELVAIPFSSFNILNFSIKLILCIIVPNLTWYLIYRKSDEFYYLNDIVDNVLSIYIKKVKRKA